MLLFMARFIRHTPNNFPFTNEMSLAKQQFIQIIQEMPNDEFITFMFAVNNFIAFISIDEEDNDFDDDEDAKK